MSITGLQGVFGFHRQVGAGQVAKGPYNAGVGAVTSTDTIQVLTLSGASTGTFRLTFRGQVTSEIPYNETAVNVQTQVEGLSNIGAGQCAVTGSAGGPYTLNFSGGSFAKQPLGVSIYDQKLTAGATIALAVTGGSAASGGKWYWLPATTVNFQPQQIVQSIPPEVGGDLWARGSYKGGVHGQGQVTFVPRGGLGLAELLMAFTGTVPSETVVAANYSSGANNKLKGNGTNGLTTGLYQYRFTPQTGVTADLPWYTLIRNVGGKFVEEFGDARLGNFAFDLAATNILTIDASFVSKACGTIALTDGGSGAQQVQNQIAGNGKPFQAVDAVVKLDSNTGSGPGAVVLNGDFNPTRLNIAFANQLSQNEHVVGSFFLQDITNLSRTANLTLSLYLKNPDLYSRTYSFGADIVNSDQAWSSKVWKGALDVNMVGAATVAAPGTNYSIHVSIPEMDYMSTPISLAGNNLVEYQLTTNVVLSQTVGVKPFTIEYITDENIL